jgi:hypothetical protein
MNITISLNAVVGRKHVSTFAHYFKPMWQIKEQQIDLS